MEKKNIFKILLMTQAFFTFSCGKNSMPVTEVNSPNVNGGETISGGVVGFDKARPIFEAKCFMCHNGNVQPKNWTIYETAKANLNNIYNRVFVLGNMPAAGSLTSSEKATLKAWIDGGGAEFSVAGSAPQTQTPSEPTTPTTPTTPAPPSTGGGISIPSGTIIGYDQVKPVFENKCLMCHNGSYQPKNWTIYETAKANLTQLNNRLFVIGDMPAAGSLSADEKVLIKAWIDAGGPLTSSGTAPSPTPTPSPVPVPSDPGEALFVNKCVGCHGSGAITMDTPLLHGQKKDYLIKQLNDFKTGFRKDLLMNAMNSMAATLSDSDINNIAGYLSAQSQCSVQVNITSLGGNIYEGGKRADRCTKCHSDFAPILKGQKTGYLKTTLQNFKNNRRLNSTMNNEARELKDSEINDIAAYFNSKRSCK